MRFLCLYRYPAAQPQKAASPDEMQAMYAAWNHWKAKFGTEIVPGEGLKPGGALVSAGVVTDGPFIEAKEIVASYSFFETASLERAVEIARECPINDVPGGSIEIREIVKY